MHDDPVGAAPRRTGRPTMEDVATRAGVSRALVSIVFRDAPGASEATRERVRAAAAEIGFTPDHRARLLGRTRTGLIGVSFGLRLTFHADLVEALYDAARGSGYELVLSGIGPGRSEEAALESLLGYRCEALVCLGPTLSAERLGTLAAGHPLVSVAARGGVPGVDSVRTDDAQGIRLAVEHLVALGHRRIAHVDGGRAPGADDRLRAFRSTSTQLGRGTLWPVVPGGPTEMEGALAGAALRALLDKPDAPTAVQVFNDRCAAGLLHALRSAGRRVPEDLSVVGFDDDRLASLPGVDLTTVRQDPDELAARAFERATTRLERVEEVRGPSEQMLSPALVVRSTTSAPRTW